MGTPARYYSSTAVDNTIGNTGGISNSATSLQCATTPSGYPGSYPFTLVLDEGTASEELVSVTAGAGTSASPWTISRGYDGTAAAAHNAGAAVGHRFSGNDMTLSRAHEAEDSSSNPLPHGLPAAAWQIGSFAVINEVTLTNSTTATVTWSSIPQTYSSLMVVFMARSTDTSRQVVELTATLNGDSGSTYSELNQWVTNTGTLTNNVGQNFSHAGWGWFGHIAGSQSGSAPNIGAGWSLLPAYASATMNKSYVSSSGMGIGTSSLASVRSSWGWYSPATQAGVTSLSLAPASGNFATGSFLGIYGIGG